MGNYLYAAERRNSMPGAGHFSWVWMVHLSTLISSLKEWEMIPLHIRGRLFCAMQDKYQYLRLSNGMPEFISTLLIIFIIIPMNTFQPAKRSRCSKQMQTEILLP